MFIPKNAAALINNEISQESISQNAQNKDDNKS